ncbi:MAG: dihydrolipoyl dehydrogenase family protein, partial [Bacteroidia bacterium]
MKYDVTVIGSGPGGYVAAIRLAQLGFKTALIEKYSTLGGTCLNVGCIPSKALLDSSEHYHNAVHNFKTHGVDVKDVQVNLAQMIERKNGVVKQTCDGIEFLMKKNKIDVYRGLGSFVNRNTIKISGEKEEQIETDKVIIATGSKPATLPGIEVDKTRVITSTEALKMTEVPKSMVIIGGGVIGLELGSVYSRLGSKVSVIEYTNSIIPTMDAALGKELQRVLRKQGFEFFFSHKVKSAINTGSEVEVKADNDKGEEVVFKADYCLVSVGRKPYTQGLGLENAGV